ncbi:MAG: putative rane protein [Clostridia bacterium]|jgi:uncharacterized membrane protein YcaP (DUF421 family)|nr:putative rane protein [Clostridia bacterium]
MIKIGLYKITLLRMNIMINFEELWVIVVRSIGSILALFVMSKVMGRKQISQLSIFDYIVGISIGSIAAQMTADSEIEWFYFVIAMSIYAGIYTLIAILTVKSMRARKFFEGAPILLMQDGKIIYKNLRKVRYEVNSLLEECRLAGYFDINDLNMAIMESDGKISFLPKVSKRPINVEDMQLSPKAEGLVANVIIDGHIMKDNLEAVGKNETWLIKQLKGKNVDSPEEVLLATCDINSTFNIFLKEESINIRHCLE